MERVVDFEGFRFLLSHVIFEPFGARFGFLLEGMLGLLRGLLAAIWGLLARPGGVLATCFAILGGFLGDKTPKRPSRIPKEGPKSRSKTVPEGHLGAQKGVRSTSTRRLTA